jgi:hypothetical protein
MQHNLDWKDSFNFLAPGLFIALMEAVYLLCPLLGRDHFAVVNTQRQISPDDLWWTKENILHPNW